MMVFGLFVNYNLFIAVKKFQFYCTKLYEYFMIEAILSIFKLLNYKSLITNFRTTITSCFALKISNTYTLKF